MERLSKKQVAMALGISETTINRLRKQGLLRGVRLGRGVQFLKQDVDAYLAGLFGVKPEETNGSIITNHNNGPSGERAWCKDQDSVQAEDLPGSMIFHAPPMPQPASKRSASEIIASIRRYGAQVFFLTKEKRKIVLSERKRSLPEDLKAEFWEHQGDIRAHMEADIARLEEEATNWVLKYIVHMGEGRPMDFYPHIRISPFSQESAREILDRILESLKKEGLIEQFPGKRKNQRVFRPRG